MQSLTRNEPRGEGSGALREKQSWCSLAAWGLGVVHLPPFLPWPVLPWLFSYFSSGSLWVSAPGPTPRHSL